MPKLKKIAKESQPASSNWLALKKTLPKTSKPEKRSHPREQMDFSLKGKAKAEAEDPLVPEPEANSITLSLVSELRLMIEGKSLLTESKSDPGKYVAIDCEMVGIGPFGTESALARVSIVNFYGAILQDDFVRQRERVTDYRTAVSGVRESDMVDAKPFMEVQARASELLKDRILVGHAVHNDLKALLLSHPWGQTRDTQTFSILRKIAKSNRPALRKLVLSELGMTIQAGEHSSVTDARATMALYRLHKPQWEKMKGMGFNAAAAAQENGSGVAVSGKKRKRSVEGEGDDDEDLAAPTGKTTLKKPKTKKTKISSGLSVIVTRRGSKSNTNAAPSSKSGDGGKGGSGDAWWSSLPTSKAGLKVP